MLSDLIIQQERADILDAIDHANLAEGSRAVYRTAIQKMTAAGVDWHDAQQVRRYGQGLKPHEKIALRSALKHITGQKRWELNSSAHPDNQVLTEARVRCYKRGGV